MRLLRYLAGIFINSFGITQPSEKERDRAAIYIAFLIALVVLLVCSVGAGALYYSHP